MIFAALMALLTFGLGAEPQGSAAPVTTVPASAPASQPATAPAWQIRVATLNINYENKSPELAIKAIRESNADVAFLQETTPKLEERLRKELKDLYPHRAFKGPGGRLPTERFGFLSRYPLDKPRLLPVKGGLFGTFIAQTTINDRRLQLVNVHLRPLLIQPGSRLPQVLAAVRKTDSSHATEVKDILRKLDLRLTTIIAGDFNSIPRSSGPQGLEDKGYIDSLGTGPTSTPADTDTPTWSWGSGPEAIRLRVDYIFHSKDLASAGAAVNRNTGSDHGLVVSELTVNDSSEPAASQPSSNPG